LNTTTFKLGELFCGAGGLALGAIKSSLQIVDHLFNIIPTWANDYDLDSCITYKNNITHDNKGIIYSDVRDLDINKLSQIDAFAYGFPCNDFSIVGEQKGIEGLYYLLLNYS
jgi:DNA (cytosine-5)-methyltransferase 1